MKATIPAPTLGAIRADESYPLDLFKRLTGLSTWAFREARRDGLPVKRVGRRGYVLGTDWHQFLAGRSGAA